MCLIDAHVLIDIFTDDPQWADCSENALAEAALCGELFINPIIYAEVSIAFKSTEKLDQALDQIGIQRTELPYPAAFLAGLAFMKYRRQGRLKRSPLPEFYIGAHAQHAGLRLLTRNPNRYRSYFPEVEIVCP